MTHLKSPYPFKPLLLALLAAAPLIAAVTPSTAEAAEDSIKAQDKEPTLLHDITVTATRTEREIFDVPSSAAVIDQKQMAHELRSTIAEQLQDIPGIEVADGGMGGGAKRVRIRGESAAHVLVLIDGMKISEQKSMDGSMIMIDPLNVERIEVIKGPASVLYGSEAIGGVINIITKKGGTKPLQATIAFTGDTSNNSVTPYFSLYGSSNGFNYRLSGDYVNAGDKHSASGRIDNSDYKQQNFSAYLDYAWNKGKVGAGYDHFWSNISIPGVQSGGADINMHLPKWERDRYYAFGELNDLSDNLKKMKLTGFLQKTRKNFWNDINVSQRITMGPTMYQILSVWQHPYVKNTLDSQGINFQTDWTFGKDHYVIAGIDYLDDDLEAKDDRQGYARMQPYNAAGIPLGSPTYIQSPYHDLYSYKGYQRTVAIFAQDEWNFHKDWTATFGLRETWIRSALEKTNDPTVKESHSHDSHLVGSLGFVYSGIEKWRLRALYSEGYRYPLLNQLYIGTTHGSSGMLYANPNLKPEKSHNFELGARYSAGGAAFDFAIYRNKATNYIASLTCTTLICGASSTTNDTIYENVDSAETYGAELTLSYTHKPLGLTPYISGAYIHRTFDSESLGGKTSNTGVPSLFGRAGIKYERRYTSSMSLFADAYARFSARAKEKLSDGTTKRYGGWGTGNFAIGARLGKKQDYFVDLNLNNLFDKRYTTAASALEEAGFHAVLRAGMEF